MACSTNSFSNAVKQHCNFTLGDNGGVMKKTSNDYRVDYFTNFNKDSTEEFIQKGLENMFKEAESIENVESKAEYVSDIFKLWCHKRHARNGEKEKLLSYRYFLELYEYYPKTIISISESGIFGEIGYWKDYLLIWKMINEKKMSDEEKYYKYNYLIEAFRTAIVNQRTKDLKKLDKFIVPYNLSTITPEKLEELLKNNTKKLDISYIGKYMVREKSAENKNLFWFIKNEDNSLIRESHVSYIVRKTLMKSKKEPYPCDDNIPFNVKKNYRKLNSKLNIALNVPEIMMCSRRFGDMDPTKFPSQFMMRNSKGLLNEKLKESPKGIYEQEHGNRYPEDVGRVELRKKMRAMFKEPKKVNAGQLFPHNIAYNASIASSTASQEMAQGQWDSKIIETKQKLEETRQKIANGELDGIDESKINISKALSTGRFIGCADVSASMTWVDTIPNRPFDIALGLTLFLSEIASEEYRDIALSFTSTPQIFHFKNKTLIEKISIMSNPSNCGYSTNYYGLHKSVLELCLNNNVEEQDIPTIVVFTDGQFDSMDKTLYNKQSDWKTIHSSIVSMWADKGFKKIPTIVYWNLDAQGKSSVQEDKDYPGIMFLQGRSVSNIKYILYGECFEDEKIMVDGQEVEVNSVTPYDTFKIAMSQDYLSILDNILKDSKEKILAFYN